MKSLQESILSQMGMGPENILLRFFNENFPGPNYEIQFHKNRPYLILKYDWTFHSELVVGVRCPSIFENDGTLKGGLCGILFENGGRLRPAKIILRGQDVNKIDLSCIDYGMLGNDTNSNFELLEIDLKSEVGMISGTPKGITGKDYFTITLGDGTLHGLRNVGVRGFPCRFVKGKMNYASFNSTLDFNNVKGCFFELFQYVYTYDEEKQFFAKEPWGQMERIASVIDADLVKDTKAIIKNNRVDTGKFKNTEHFRFMFRNHTNDSSVGFVKKPFGDKDKNLKLTRL